MSVFTIYHNPRCSKSRLTLALLEERGVEFQVVHYLENPPDAGALRLLLQQLGVSAKELMRSGESVYKELQLGRAGVSEDELITAMVQNPILIERPIVSDGKRAVIGRPPENLEGLF